MSNAIFPTPTDGFLTVAHVSDVSVKGDTLVISLMGQPHRYRYTEPSVALAAMRELLTKCEAFYQR